MGIVKMIFFVKKVEVPSCRFFLVPMLCMGMQIRLIHVPTHSVGAN
jgi:hypothetical protein